MKRIIAIVISAVLMLCTCVPAFADMDGPSFANFDVIVTNPLGTYVYSYNMDEVKGYIIKDTVITINGEYEFEDEEYYSVEYNGVYGYIKVADTALTEEVFPPEKGYKLDEKKSSVVISDGLYMYKGPSEKFEKIGEEIAVGTVLTYQYMNDEYNAPWAYVTYKGVSGWAYVYEYGEAFYCATPFEEDTQYSGDLYVVLEDVRLTDIPANPEYEGAEYYKSTGVKYVSKEIPIGTRLELADYYYKNAKSIWVYTEYNGVKGWIETDTYDNGGMYNATATGYKEPSYYYVWQEKGIPVYSVAGDTSSEVICMLEKGTFAKKSYSAWNGEAVQIDDNPDDFVVEESMWVDESWFGVEVDGKLGWIFNDCTELDEGYTTLDIALDKTVNKEVNLRKETAKDSEVIAVIPAGSDIVRLGQGNECYLVDYDGKIGYISEDSIVEKSWEEYEADNYSYEDYFAGRKVEETTLPATTVQQTTQAASEAQTEAETTEKAEDNGFTPAQIAIFCGAGAVIIALTAAVTIILINKKKKA